MSTPDVGAGFCPAGFSPAGWGTPATADAPGGVAFADPTTGASLDGRMIDPSTGDYVMGSNGVLLGATAAQQGMLLAVKTIRGSAAYALMGQGFTRIMDIGPAIQRTIEDEVRQATASLVQQKLVLVKNVQVNPQGTTGEFVTINWFDLTTGLEQPPLTA